MCGIAGILHLDGQPVPSDILGRMVARLHHRGPDGRHQVCLGPVGLGHTRLRIIDLSERGRQPLANEDETVWVSFNGEIYDFAEHRRRLTGLGHRFSSDTDTEVLVHQYEEFGLEGLAALNGMFAFALWDARRRRLALGRDRTGQKPLYVHHAGDRVAFASELKALWAHPGLDDALQDDAIPTYLSHGYIPGEGTFHRFVQKIEPGTVRLFDAAGGERRHRFWTLPTTAERPPAFPEAVRQVRTLVEQAVERRMVADVPVGAFLSGGVDSSVVVAVMARAAPGRVRTFSLGFEGDPRYDESEEARRVAAALGTEHTELRVQPNSFELLSAILDHWDEPFADSSAIPTYLVSRLARAHTTVALTGDGGDELFAGYARLASVAYAERVPRPLRVGLAAVAERVPIQRERQDGARAKALRFARRLGPDLSARLHRWIAVFPPDELEALLGREVHPGYPHSVLDAEADDPLNRVLRLNARTYLPDDLNAKVDRASMAHALEARAPFLDAELMRAVFALPGRYKINRGRRKWILREAFRDLVPEWVFRRRKMGFGLPLGRWFAGPLRPLVGDLLESSSARFRDHLDPGAVAKLVDEHVQGRRDHGHKLWALMMLETWLQRRADRPLTTSAPPSTPVADIGAPDLPDGPDDDREACHRPP